MISVIIYHYYMGENNYLFTLQIDYLDYELTFNWYKNEALQNIMRNYSLHKLLVYSVVGRVLITLFRKRKTENWSLAPEPSK